MSDVIAVSVYIPNELRRKIEVLAQKNKRSISAQICYMLESETSKKGK